MSRTARMIAAYRARATEAFPALCRDPWAAELAGDDGFALAERCDRDVASMTLWIALRTAAFDAEVRAFDAVGAADGGPSQVALLGAGLDTRAARLAASHRRFLELDRPESQAEKRRLVAALATYPADAAAWVPAAIGEADVPAALAAGGLDPARPALVLMEGLSYYLPAAVLRDLLRGLGGALAPGSRLAFDYAGPQRGRESAPGVPAASWTAELGEPMLFRVDDVGPLLREAGLPDHQVRTFDALCEALTGATDPQHYFARRYLAVATIAPR